MRQVARAVMGAVWLGMAGCLPQTGQGLEDLPPAVTGPAWDPFPVESLVLPNPSDVRGAAESAARAAGLEAAPWGPGPEIGVVPEGPAQPARSLVPPARRRREDRTGRELRHPVAALPLGGAHRRGGARGALRDVAPHAGFGALPRRPGRGGRARHAPPPQGHQRRAGGHRHHPRDPLRREEAAACRLRRQRHRSARLGRDRLAGGDAAPRTRQHPRARRAHGLPPRRRQAGAAAHRHHRPLAAPAA